MNHISATVITIGDELLIGQVVDTNSAWIGQALNSIGIWVKRRIAVGDKWDDIWNTLEEEQRVADIIIITGGLGPTADDITKPLLNKYFNGELIIDEAALQNVQQIFARYNRPMIQSNYKQAEVPNTCKVIQNARGTAPGMHFEQKGKIFFSLPGVPYEMQGMMEAYILPELKKRFVATPIRHRTVTTCGLGESFLAEKIKDFETSLPTSIKLAYLPGANIVRLRLTEQLEINRDSVIDEYFNQLQELIPEIIITNEDISIPEAIAQLLLRKNKTIATAESCTGGYIAHLLTAIPGASRYFYGSIVSYDNSVKENVLNVKEETIKTYGAVSEETVIEMAKNVLEIINVDYAIAVSGILGPDGGSPDKPVGTVWIAVANKTITKTQKFSFRYNREKNMEATANNAFNLLRLLIKEVG